MGVDPSLRSYAVLGALNINLNENSQQVIDALRFLNHPFFEPGSLEADIGLVELVSPMTYTGKQTVKYLLHDIEHFRF